MTAVVLLAGCANLEGPMGDILRGTGGGSPARTAATVTYECDDDRRFVATFSADRNTVRVQADDDETYRLELAGREGNRRAYQDEDEDVRLVVLGGGDEARLRISDEEDFEDCRADL